MICYELISCYIITTYYCDVMYCIPNVAVLSELYLCKFGLMWCINSSYSSSLSSAMTKSSSTTIMFSSSSKIISMYAVKIFRISVSKQTFAARSQIKYLIAGLMMSEIKMTKTKAIKPEYDLLNKLKMFLSSNHLGRERAEYRAEIARRRPAADSRTGHRVGRMQQKLNIKVISNLSMLFNSSYLWYIIQHIIYWWLYIMLLEGSHIKDT